MPSRPLDLRRPVALLGVGVTLGLATTLLDWRWNGWFPAVALVAVGAALLTYVIVGRPAERTPPPWSALAALLVGGLVAALGVAAAIGVSWPTDPRFAEGLPVGVRGDLTLVAESTDATVVRALTESGDERWRTEGRPAGLFGDDLVLTGTQGEEGRVAIIGAADGRERWSVTRPGEATVLAVTDDTVVVVHRQDEVRGLDRQDGTERWSRQTLPGTIRLDGQYHHRWPPPTGPVILATDHEEPVAGRDERVSLLDARTGTMTPTEGTRYGDLTTTPTGAIELNGRSDDGRTQATVLDPAGESPGPQQLMSNTSMLLSSSSARSVVRSWGDDGLTILSISAVDGTVEEIEPPDGWKVQIANPYQPADDSWVLVARTDAADDGSSTLGLWRPGTSRVTDTGMTRISEVDVETNIVTNADGWVEITGDTRSFVGLRGERHLVIEPDGTTHRVD